MPRRRERQRVHKLGRFAKSVRAGFLADLAIDRFRRGAIPTYEIAGTDRNGKKCQVHELEVYSESKLMFWAERKNAAALQAHVMHPREYGYHPPPKVDFPVAFERLRVFVHWLGKVFKGCHNILVAGSPGNGGLRRSERWFHGGCYHLHCCTPK